MKFYSIALTAFAASASVLSTLAAPLVARAPAALTSYAGQASGTFWRGIYGDDITNMQTKYPLRHHPVGHSTAAGDFSRSGGFYVFHDEHQADAWAKARSNTPREPNAVYYLVKLKYTKASALAIKTFTTGTPEWRAFVTYCHAGTGTAPAHADIVEGPISVGAHTAAGPQVYLEGGQMVYQAAFIGQAALNTLVVEERRQCGGHQGCVIVINLRIFVVRFLILNLSFLPLSTFHCLHLTSLP